MLKISDRAPDFTLKNQKNEVISLNSALGKKLILYFYPKDNTPGCTKQACDFSSLKTNFTSQNTIIYGISADTVESHQLFINNHNITIDLLSDPEKKVIQAYGVWHEKNNFGKKYMGINRSTFLIDENGIIRKIWRNVKTLEHARKALEAILTQNP